MLSHSPAANPNIKKRNNLNLFLEDYFNLFIAIFLIICLALSYFLILSPKLEATKLAIQDNLNEQRKLYTTQQNKLATMRAITDVYKKVNQENLKKLDGVLPPEYPKERLFGDIDDIMSKQGIRLNSISISAVKPEDGADNGIGVINMNLSLGMINYVSLKGLLKNLESSLQIFDVTSVSFSSGGETAELILSTYYRKK